MTMTAPQRRTALVLFIWLCLFLLSGLALFAWEMYAVAKPDSAALITTVMKIVWAQQPWVVLIFVTIGTGILAFLGGHFFAGPREELDRIRMNDARMKQFVESQSPSDPSK